MNGDVQGLEQIQGRLAKLERQNRMFKQAGAASLIVAASILLMGQTARTKPVQVSQSNTVEASQFILKDKSGKVRANFSIDESPSNSGVVQLVFYDVDGKQRVKLGSGNPYLGGTLQLADEKGKNRIVILSSGALGGSLGLDDSNGFPVTLLTTDGAVLPSLEAKSVSLKDTDGNVRARLFMTEKSTAKVGEIWPNLPMPPETKNLPVTFNPSPTLALYDLKGKARVYLDGDGNINAGTVSVSDSQGHSLGSLMAVEDYGAMLALDNGRGEQRLFLEPGHLELSDDAGFKSSLGVTKELVTLRTGETHQTSAASLLLFDKNANVTWKAP
ncbi:MAG: hypothetical protein ACLPH3_23720 [Terracidiphilus sp.]